MNKGFRKQAVAGLVAGTAVITMASAAFACVTFKGQMTVDGHDGDTTVVGTGNSHGYCATGRPLTAAAGHLADNITATVAAADCGTLLGHKLDSGTYEVRYNNKKAYTFDGTFWNMISGTGCWASGQSATMSVLGTFNVSSTGSGSWTGTLGTLNGTAYYPPTGEAANFCVGRQSTLSNGSRPGLLAPYRLLQV